MNFREKVLESLGVFNIIVLVVALALVVLFSISVVELTYQVEQLTSDVISLSSRVDLVEHGFTEADAVILSAVEGNLEMQVLFDNFVP